MQIHRMDRVWAPGPVNCAYSGLIGGVIQLLFPYGATRLARAAVRTGFAEVSAPSAKTRLHCTIEETTRLYRVVGDPAGMVRLSTVPLPTASTPPANCFCNGGGGYGDPLERDSDKAEHDVRIGLCAGYRTLRRW
jgi:hypothetical protein